MDQSKLLDWINSHDCGVNPTAVMVPEGIEIRVQCVQLDDEMKPVGYTIERTIVNTLAEARDVLGY